MMNIYRRRRDKMLSSYALIRMIPCFNYSDRIENRFTMIKSNERVYTAQCCYGLVSKFHDVFGLNILMLQDGECRIGTERYERVRGSLTRIDSILLN